MSIVTEHIIKGTEAAQKEHDEAEKKKQGYLRGGSSGCLVNGTFYGESPGFAYLRMRGIKYDTVNFSNQLMMDGGVINEDIWVSTLRRSWPGVVVTEDDIPTKWLTKNGTPVTGRPDVGLKARESDDFLQEGIELKQCMSFNSAYERVISKTPDTKHVIQAAHYKWQHGECPWSIWYTNRNNFDAPDWAQFRPYPLPGEPGSEHLTYRFNYWGEINPKTNKPRKHKIDEERWTHDPSVQPTKFVELGRINPFVQGFDVEFTGGRGQVLLRDAMLPGADWEETVFDIEGIREYFEFVSELTDDSPVPPGALNVNPFGKKKGWKYGDYFHTKELHPDYLPKGMLVGEWVEKIKKVVPQ